MRALLLSAAAAAQAQAPWPQPDGGASRSRAVPAEWKRNATTLTQLNAVPLCSPVLIGANGTLYGAASDGLLHAFAPSGLELWATPLAGTGTCSLRLALTDDGAALITFLPNAGTGAAIGIVPLATQGPLSVLLSPNSTVFEVLVSGEQVLVMAGAPTGTGYYLHLALTSYSLQGQEQWRYEYASTALANVGGAALAASKSKGAIFSAFSAMDLEGYYTTRLAAFLSSSGKAVWTTSSDPSVNPPSFCCLLMAPSDSALLLENAVQILALSASTGSPLWPQPLSSAAPLSGAFAASHSGSYLDSFLFRVETATGATSQLPVPPVCSGAVLLDSSGALFCVMDRPPDTLLLAFDSATGSELLSVEVPFTSASAAFAASGQLYIGSGAGLFTLLPPQPSPSAAPSPPAPAAVPSAALPALAWGALGGACAGAAAALAAVAGVPRLRAWLARQGPPPPPAQGAGGAPAFAAADDYARLN